jgi:hypothetical protein
MNRVPLWMMLRKHGLAAFVGVLLLAAASMASGCGCPSGAVCEDDELPKSNVPGWLSSTFATVSSSHNQLFLTDSQLGEDELARLDAGLNAAHRDPDEHLQFKTVTREKKDALATMITFNDTKFVVASFDTGNGVPDEFISCQGSNLCLAGPGPVPSKTAWYVEGHPYETPPGGLRGLIASLEEQ